MHFVWECPQYLQQLRLDILYYHFISSQVTFLYLCHQALCKVV